MTVTQWLAVVALAAATLFVPLSMVWLWRDMRERKRPVWLRVLVLVSGFVSGIGIAVWGVDLRRHPHDPRLTKRDVIFQRYERPRTA